MAESNMTIAINAVDKASQNIERVSGSLDKLDDSVVKAGKAMALGLAAAGTAAIGFATNAVMQFSEVGDEVEKMSKRTGLSAEAVSALRVAADMGGTSIETMETAVKKMQVGLDNFNAKGSVMSGVLKDMGMSVGELKAMTPEQQFEALGNAIGTIADPALRTQAAMEAFGKAGTDLLPTFEGGKFSMAAWTEEARKLGVNFDDISAAKAAALNDSIGKMKMAWSGLTLQLGGFLAPILTDFIEDKLPKIIEGVKGVIEKVKDVTDWFAKHKEIMIGVATAITVMLVPAMISALVPAVAAAITAFGAMAVAAAPFLITGAVIAGVVAGLVWLWENSDKVNKFIKDAWTATWEGISNFMAGIGDGIKAVVGKVFDWLIEKVNKYISLVNVAIGLINKIPGVDIGKIPEIQGRAIGGPVTAGTPYVVGEQGPELFVPNSNGSIVPNRQNQTSMNISIMEGATINVSNSADEKRFAEQVAASLATVLQSQRNGLSSSI